MHATVPFKRMLLLGLLILPAGVLAQGAEPWDGMFGETVVVEIVNVEVFVTDQDGNPVTGLTRDDFQILEDGELVEMTHFSAYQRGGGGGEASAGAPATEPAVPAAGEGPAHLILFVDNVNTGPASRYRVLGQIQSFVEGHLRPEDQVMLVSYDPALTVRLPFSRDREALREALAGLVSTPGRRLTADIENRRAIELIREIQIQSSRMMGGSPCPAELGIVARAFATQELDRVERTIGSLTSFIDSLAGIPGRKAILHVSDGIPLKVGWSVYQTAIELCDGTGMNQGIAGATDVGLAGIQAGTFDPAAAVMDQESFDTSSGWRRLAAHANAHRVSFYTMQAAGLPGLRSASATSPVRTVTVGAESMTLYNDQDTLFLLADETGGRTLVNTNDFAPGLERMAADLGSYYHLGYRPRSPADGMTHRIRVEVDRPATRVRYRKSYQSKTAHEQVADRLLSCLLHDVGDNPLKIRTDLQPGTPADDEHVKVSLRLQVPLGNLTLLPMPPLHVGMITVFVVVRDDQGFLSAVRQSTAPVRVPSDRVEADKNADFVYEVELVMRRGEHVVAAAVRDEMAGTTSYRREELKLP
ncbi:MAG: VWA domain-containing protein [bacterium]|nr:VWA domain-containing protein [bacterium]